VLPEFIVIGAQKAATSTVCEYLAAHPGVHFSTPKEPFFFDRDDMLSQPHFFFECREQFLEFDWKRRKNELLAEYSNVFEGASEEQMCGEGTTTYLSSYHAPRRIKEVLPDVKLVATLRHPTKRLYSAYWHEVKMRRAIYSFEDYLRFEPYRVFHNSLYERHVRRYLDFFPRDQMHFIVFEEFIQNPDDHIRKLFEFLDLEPLDVQPQREKVNTARVPQSLTVQRILNRVLQFTPRNYTPWEMRDPERPLHDPLHVRVLHRLGYMNLTAENYPPMDSEIREYLDEVLHRENEGLGDLIGKDLEQIWWDG
jgi:hypothetical protein